MLCNLCHVYRGNNRFTNYAKSFIIVQVQVQLQVGSLCVVRQHGAALAENEARNVGGELDLVIYEVIFDLLPVDEVPEGGEVLEPVRAEPPVGHGCLVCKGLHFSKTFLMQELFNFNQPRTRCVCLGSCRSPDTRRLA